MSLAERILTRLFPTEAMPWGRRWKIAGALTGHEDSSRAFFKSPLSLFGRGVYLHRMVRPDEDRPTHDHRYDWASYILAGSYLEKVRDPSGKVTYRTWVAGQVNRKRAEESHKILAVSPTRVTWTLFLSGRGRREWGFTVPDPGNASRSVWVHHSTYKQWDEAWMKRKEQIAERGMD